MQHGAAGPDFSPFVVIPLARKLVLREYSLRLNLDFGAEWWIGRHDIKRTELKLLVKEVFDRQVFPLAVGLPVFDHAFGKCPFFRGAEGVEMRDTPLTVIVHKHVHTRNPHEVWVDIKAEHALGRKAQTMVVLLDVLAVRIQFFVTHLSANLLRHVVKDHNNKTPSAARWIDAFHSRLRIKHSDTHLDRVARGKELAARTL